NSRDPRRPRAATNSTAAIIVTSKISDIEDAGDCLRVRRARDDREGGGAGQTETRCLRSAGILPAGRPDPGNPRSVDPALPVRVAGLACWHEPPTRPRR